jgi:hypothetical protein
VSTPMGLTRGLRSVGEPPGRRGEIILVNGANYTERRGTTRNPPFSGGPHSQLGDGTGRFLYDPWEGGADRNNPGTVYVRGSIFFTEKGE